MTAAQGARRRRSSPSAKVPAEHRAKESSFATVNESDTTSTSTTSAPFVTAPPRSAEDGKIASTLLVIACAVRFANLSYIDTVIFDEVHYGKFASWLQTGHFFFNVHPPAGSLVIAAIGAALRFDPTADPFAAAGDALSSPAQAFAARAPVALLGALTVPALYALCRSLRLSRQASFLGAAFMLLDTMHVTQSRLIMVDAILVFFTCVSLLAAVRFWDARDTMSERKAGAATSRVSLMARSARVAALLLTTGFLCGFAIAVKWTAFAAPIAVLAVSLFGVSPLCRSPLNILEIVALAASMCASYLFSFCIFLLTLSKSGTGDAFMSLNFQACLAGSTESDVSGGRCSMSLFSRIVELNKMIYQYSKGIRGSDRWGSTWFQWIVNWRGALYYRDDGAIPDTYGIIYVLMNPVMIVCINGLMVLFIGLVFYRIRYRSSAARLPPSPVRNAEVGQIQRGVVLLFGWMLSMLPTMVVYRSGPVYQYMPSLLFAQALGALAFDLVVPPRSRTPLVVACTLALLAAFVYWSPWVYGLQLTAAQHESRRWMSNWN
jgi:dolichyl-phosphate-mannose--protein O-mannosyl transferase